MRKSFVGLLGGLVALAGFSGSAGASATIDLIWATSGTSTTSVLTSSTSIVLNVVLTAGVQGSRAAGVSVDYSTLVGDFSISGFASTPGGPLPLSLGATTDTGTRIENINSAAIPPGLGTGLTAAGQSHILGTITFDSTGLGGGFTLQSDALGPTDAIVDITGLINLTPTSTFNTATINVVPEPSTLFLLSMGLGGLYGVGRRSGKKR
jgi:hypothetical protein